MTVLSFPTIRAPVSASLQLLGATQAHTSPFDGSQQVLSMPGQRWSASITWGAMPYTDWRVLQAFLSKLRGRAGRFVYTHPHTFRIATAAIGSPKVKGADQRGVTLIADGFTPSATVMKAGDFFSMLDPPGRSRMYQVVADATASVAGEATLQIAPPLRSSPADNTDLNLTTPSPLWMLAGDDEGAITWHARDTTRAGLTLNIVEALYGRAETVFTLDGPSVLA